MSASMAVTEDVGDNSEENRLDGASDENGLIKSDDADKDEDWMVPDGGWGWIVCAGSFLVNFILDGTMFSFGILLLELLDDFRESKSVSSWVGSALLGMSMMMGPVVSLLLKSFSIRQVTIAGTILSASGFIASVFAPNVYVLIFTYGIVGGIGFSMVFLPAIIVVGLYFNRKRAIATGIATSGSGLGMFAYAYLCDQLLRIFTWRQTVLILAGILLNCVACGMVFRPLVTSRQRPRSSGKVDRSSGSVRSTYCEIEEVGPATPASSEKEGATTDNGANVRHPRLHQSSASELQRNTLDKKPPAGDICREAFNIRPEQLQCSRHRHHCRHHHHHHHHHRRHSLQHTRLLAHQDLAGESPEKKNALAQTLMPDDRLYRSVDNFWDQKPSAREVDRKLLYFSETQLAPDSCRKCASRDVERERIAQGLVHPTWRKDIYYGGSVSHLAEFRKCGGSMTSFLALMTKPDTGYGATSISVTRWTKYFRQKCARILHSLIDLDLFRNKAFLCLLVTFTMWTVQSVPLTYLPDLAVSKGVSRDQAAFLISIVGITNTAGRIVAGIVTDTVRIRCIWLYVVALLLAAVVNYGIPWCTTFPLLAFASAMFGLCMAVAVSMRTIVLAEQLGIEVLTRSFGVVALFQGFAFIVNPPIAGKLFDETGAYVWPFILSGTMYLVSGLASLAVGIWYKTPD